MIVFKRFLRSLKLNRWVKNKLNVSNHVKEKNKKNKKFIKVT